MVRKVKLVQIVRDRQFAGAMFCNPCQAVPLDVTCLLLYSCQLHFAV